MIRFFCKCGAELFFDNNQCGACGSQLGFDPQCQQFHGLQERVNGDWHSVTSEEVFTLCSMRDDLGCNWLISANDKNHQCLSCRTTRTIPTLTQAKNHLRWQRLEQTKRRALYVLLRLRLPFKSKYCDNNSLSDFAEQPPLIFDFLEDQRSNPDVADEFIYSGHSKGVITINVAEADDSFRATNRELMNELYRTLLGHFRHELGHYYALLLTEEEKAECRQYFGDERQDYQTTLEHYYVEGVRDDWRDNYITAYASSHPLEDWAETWSHYLHIADTLETAVAYGLIAEAGNADSFQQSLSHWAQLVVVLNALNRSMGVDDAYPFVITAAVREKLCFIDRLVKAWHASGHNAARI
jgi:hypothetical protein